MNDLVGIMIAFVLSFGGLLYYTYDNLEYKGYEYEAADASFKLLLGRFLKGKQPDFDLPPVPHVSIPAFRWRD